MDEKYCNGFWVVCYFTANKRWYVLNKTDSLLAIRVGDLEAGKRIVDCIVENSP